jgi:hypothetical protein
MEMRSNGLGSMNDERDYHRDYCHPHGNIKDEVEFPGHHINQAYYKSGIMSPEYGEHMTSPNQT